MNKLTYISYLFLLLANFLFANPETLTEANKLYHAGKYEEAITSYEAILKKNKHSVALYYNLANSYYKMNHVASSIYYYEKALLLDPNDADVLNNIQFAQAMTVDEIKPIPKIGFSKFVQNFTGLLHYNNWAWLTVGFSIVTFIAFLIYYFSYESNTKRIAFITLLFAFTFLIITVSTSLYERDRVGNEQPAIIFSVEVPLKEEPRSDSEEVVLLHEGTKVFVKEKFNDWAKVELLNGTEGWMTTNSIKSLK